MYLILARLILWLLMTPLLAAAQEKCPGTVHVDWMLASKPLPIRVIAYSAIYTIYASDYVYSFFSGGPKPPREMLQDKPSLVRVKMFCPGIMATVDGRPVQIGALTGSELPDDPALAQELALANTRRSLPQLGRLFYEDGAMITVKYSDGAERDVLASSVSLPKD